MMWVEVLSRHHDVVSRHRCGDEVQVGRAYDNDIVLDDPDVAPHHLRIVRDETGMPLAEDLGTRNGIVALDGLRRSQIPLDGYRILRVGRTLLRVRGPEFVVAPERPLGRVLHAWPFVVALAVVVLGLSVLTLWLNQTQAPQVSYYLLAVISVSFLVLMWSTAWSVLSRIFTGAAHFDRHLLVALAGLVVFYLFDELADFGTYAFAWRAVAQYAYVVNWMLFAGLCYAHLRVMGPTRLRAKGAAVAAVALAAIAVQAVSRMDPGSTDSTSASLATLKPPFLRVRAAQPLDAFLQRTDRLRGVLDDARTAPPGGRGWFDSDQEEE
jgi:hypothetical protein